MRNRTNKRSTSRTFSEGLHRGDLPRVSGKDRLRRAKHAKVPSPSALQAVSPGFTVAELLAVIAILVVLMAFAGVAVFNYVRDLTMNEYDAAAKSLYVASQNNIADLQASGEWKANEDNRYFVEGASHDTDPYTPTAMRSDQNDITQNSAALHYFYVTASYARTNGILPAGTIDETIRANDFVIEYCYETATVYGVFYTKDTSAAIGEGAAQSYYQQAAANGSSTFRDKAVRRANNPVIGYYGGADAAGQQYETLAAPVVKAGHSSSIVVNDPNLASEPQWNTSVMVTLANKTNASAEPIVLVVEKNVFDPRVSCVTTVNGKQTLTDITSSNVCSFNSDARDTYAINLTALKGVDALADTMKGYAALDEYTVSARCSSSKVVCLPTYGYGTGVWPSSDRTYFTSNIIADFEQSADVWLYGSDDNKSESFNLCLENYYNETLFQASALFYSIDHTSNIAFDAASGVALYRGNNKHPKAVATAANSAGKTCYLYEGIEANFNMNNAFYHKLSGFSVGNVEAAKAENKEAITITYYEAKEAANGTFEPGARIDELVINVRMLDDQKEWESSVVDKGAYAEVLITAGKTEAPLVRIVSNVPGLLAADWTNPLQHARSDNGASFTMNRLNAGGSGSVKFFKTDPSATIDESSFTITAIRG